MRSWVRLLLGFCCTVDNQTILSRSHGFDSCCFLPSQSYMLVCSLVSTLVSLVRLSTSFFHARLLHQYDFFSSFVQRSSQKFHRVQLFALYNIKNQNFFFAPAINNRLANKRKKTARSKSSVVAKKGIHFHFDDARRILLREYFFAMK